MISRKTAKPLVQKPEVQFHVSDNAVILKTILLVCTPLRMLLRKCLDNFIILVHQKIGLVGCKIDLCGEGF